MLRQKQKICGKFHKFIISKQDTFTINFTVKNKSVDNFMTGF